MGLAPERITTPVIFKREAGRSSSISQQYCMSEHRQRCWCRTPHPGLFCFGWMPINASSDPAVRLPPSPLTMETGRRKQYGPTTTEACKAIRRFLVIPAINWETTGSNKTTAYGVADRGLSEMQHEL